MIIENDNDYVDMKYNWFSSIADLLLPKQGMSGTVHLISITAQLYGTCYAKAPAVPPDAGTGANMRLEVEFAVP